MIDTVRTRFVPGDVSRALLMGCAVAISVLVVWELALFARARLRLEDIYFVPVATSGEIVIVGIDDKSLQAYGRSPVEWPRTLYADLTSFLDAAGARVIAFDMLFSESEQEDMDFAAAIQAATQSDNRTKIVMAAAGVSGPALTLDNANTAAFPRAVRYASALMPNESFLDVISTLGYVNTVAETDNTIRRQSSVIFLDEMEPALSFSLATYLAYLRVPPSASFDVVRQDGDRLYVTNERKLSVDENGLWRQDFFGPSSSLQSSTFQVFSFVDVLTGAIDADLFGDKIVLIGIVNSARIVDQYLVPTSTAGQFMAGVEIQANAIETLLQDTAPNAQSRISQALSIVVTALVSSFIYARLSWYLKLVACIILLILWMIIAFTAFNLYQEIFNPFHPSLAIVLSVFIGIGLDINTEIKRRRRSESLLGSVVELSRQRLHLERIWQALAADFKHILPGSSGAIWQWDATGGQLENVHQWSKRDTVAPNTMAGLARRAFQQKTLLTEETGLAIPFVWQQEVLAVCTVSADKRAIVSSQIIALLGELSQQIAPGLKNAFLFNQVEHQHEVLETILEGSPAGVVVVDENLWITHCNTVLGETLGADFISYVGQSFSTLLQILEVDSEVSDKLVESLKGAQAFRHKLKIRNMVFNLDAAPLAQHNHWVFILSDITQLVELNDLRTRMIHLASHDLKNPLSIAMGYISLLSIYEQEGLSDDYQQAVDRVSLALENMNRIINDVLDLEQSRSGKVEYLELDVALLVREISPLHSTDAALKNQQFHTQIGVEPVYVKGDYGQLSQAFSNLIGNAIKYTPEQGEISVSLYLESANVMFKVVDTGYGIPQEAQDRLFTEFYRVRTEATADIPGTGLGLSLVKSIIDAHGGRVWVESKENRGSTFFISLPLAQQH